MDTQDSQDVQNVETVETSAEETPSLRDSLEAAFKASEAEGDETSEKPPEAASDPDDKRDEKGRFKAKAEDAAEKPEKPEETTEEKPTKATPDNEPPSSWNAKGRELYAKADPELRNYIRQREAEQREGVAKLKTEFEGKARFADEMWREVAPFHGMIQAEGGTPATAVRELLNMAALMRTGTQAQKRQVLLTTAQQFGVDLSIPDDQQRTDPAYDALQRELAGLKQTLTGWQQQSAEQQRQGLQSQIEQFATAHPHFEAVRVTMGRMMDSGEATTLDDAYDKACWANPEIRAALLAEQKSKGDQATRERAAQESERKKAAGVSVTGAPGLAGNGKTAPAPTLRAELERQFSGRA